MLTLRIGSLLSCVGGWLLLIEPGHEQLACARCSAHRDSTYVSIARRQIYESASVHETPISRWLSGKLGPCQHQWRFIGRRTP